MSVNNIKMFAEKKIILIAVININIMIMVQNGVN